MSPLAKLHSHPDYDPHLQQPGKKHHVYGHLLEEGDELEKGDVYASSNGSWESCPVPGAKLGKGTAVVWVRPT